MKIFASIALAIGLTSSLAYATNSINLQCPADNITATSKKYVLNRTLNKQTQVYFLHNTSKNTLVVTHPVRPVGASAGWDSYLSPGNWSAIAVTKPDFDLQCYRVTTQERSEVIACGKNMQICQPRQAIKLHNPGDYWLVENQPPKSFLKALKKRGVDF